MLDDDDGRLLEEPDEAAGGVGVENVVPGELLALELAHAAEEAGGVVEAVDGGGLVGVFAVAGEELAGEGDGEAGRKRGVRFGRVGRRVGGRGDRRRRLRVVDSLAEPLRDRCVVGLRVCKCLRGELAAQGLGRHAAALLERGEDSRVVVRIDDDDDAGVVFRRGAHHRRAADVDLFDARGEGGRRVFHRLAERVEVDGDDVDARDAERVERREVRRLAAVGEDAAVHLGMEGLHASVEDLGEAGHFRDGRHRQPRLRQRLRGAARGDDLDAERDEAAGEVEKPSLVRHRKQRAAGRQHRQSSVKAAQCNSGGRRGSERECGHWGADRCGRRSGAAATGPARLHVRAERERRASALQPPARPQTSQPATKRPPRGPVAAAPERHPHRPARTSRRQLMCRNFAPRLAPMVEKRAHWPFGRQLLAAGLREQQDLARSCRARVGEE